MKNIITILTILIVFLTLGLKANNGEPEISQKTRELVNKIDRNVMAVQVMFSDGKTNELKKKTLYHRYWVVMMDYRHKLKEGKSDEEVEILKEEIHKWNMRTIQLLNMNTEMIEWELSTTMVIEEIKKIVLS